MTENIGELKTMAKPKLEGWNAKIIETLKILVLMPNASSRSKLNMSYSSFLPLFPSTSTSPCKQKKGGTSSTDGVTGGSASRCQPLRTPKAPFPLVLLRHKLISI